VIILPEDGELAGQPTLAHFKNTIAIQSLRRLRDQLIASFNTPPAPLRAAAPPRVAATNLPGASHRRSSLR
jgi:hypothetical protein